MADEPITTTDAVTDAPAAQATTPGATIVTPAPTTPAPTTPASTAKPAAASGKPAAATAKAPAATTVTTPTDTDSEKGYWPDDWQKRLAGDDEKSLKQISRYGSVDEIWKKAKSLEQRLSSGEFKTALPKNPTADDLAAWRKDNGIPDTPDKYDLKGINIPEGDREVINDFLANVAHSENFTPTQTRKAVESYYRMQERNDQVRAEKDEKDRGAGLDALSQEWGGQFTRNNSLIKNLVNKFPESVRESIFGARLADGTLLFNHPEVMRGFLALELERNPAGVTVHSGDGDLGKSMVERYDEIMKYMNTERSKYNKDNKTQEEYRKLISAMQQHGLMDSKGNLKAA